MVFRPYPRRLESLTICWYVTRKAAHFPHNLSLICIITLFLSQERRTTARGWHNPNAEQNWYFCFFIAYREPGSFCLEKRGKNRRAKRVEGGLALAVFPCRMCVILLRIVTVPRDWKLIPRDHYLATWRSQLFGNPQELPVWNVQYFSEYFTCISSQGLPCELLAWCAKT